MIFHDLMNGNPSSSEVRSSRQCPRAPRIQHPLKADLITRSFSEPVPLHIHQSLKPILTSYNDAKLNACRSSPTILKVQRRKYRYDKAEGSLAYSLWLCQREPSPHALRLRALEEVVTRLSAHADDAKASATRLRIALADREVDPAIYSALQRSRWMEEHRQEAMEKDIVCIRKHLSSLSESLEQDSISPKTSTVQRRRESLLRFFETTRRELPISPRSKTSKKGLSPKAPLPLLLPQKLNMISQADSAASESVSDVLDSLMTPCSPAFSLPTATPIMPSKQISISSAGDGVVTIFQSQPHAQASPVPSDLAVAIPDYAWDLINNFSPNGDGELTEISSTLSTHTCPIGTTRSSTLTPEAGF
ncbi:hypothetical protein BDQ12DRAFT_725898 [Crucibulum laeve]|uniref:Uncharacterized protein n=1 Tax=Crucibulum laeve TaxID=68775 RepID=A0A5C3LUF1_9AGAR|nr:hypothetical protein BDQ12DRAFT_725898 [Crucibulum laeve]